MNTQRTNERRIEQQLDEFRIKWKKEIQQRTVYGHVLDDKQKEEEQQKEETRNNEEQVNIRIFCFLLLKIKIYLLGKTFFSTSK